MAKNKLLFKLQNDFGDDFILVADNEKDLIDYLLEVVGYHSVEKVDDKLAIVENYGLDTVYAELKWIKQV